MQGGLRPLQKPIPLSETGSSAMKVEVASQHTDSTDEAIKAIARLLGRQAAREAFRAASAEAESSDATALFSAETEVSEE